MACGVFCHAGHEIIPTLYGVESSQYCDCGAAEFQACSRLNAENPIAKGESKKNFCSCNSENYLRIRDAVLIELYSPQ